jgi:hypothetical protein
LHDIRPAPIIKRKLKEFSVPTGSNLFELETNMAITRVKTSMQKIRKTRPRQLRTANQNQPKSTENPRTIVPPPQSERIMLRYAGGESIRQIAREEQRDRATVTKIVRSDEMNAEVRKMREQYYGLGYDALHAVQHALKIQKDGRLGHQLLANLGVIPSAEERHAMAAEEAMNVDRASLTPFEVAMTEDDEGQPLQGNMFRVAYGTACMIEEGAKGFDFEVPTPEEIRFRRKALKVANEITGGRFHEICMKSGPEEKRIRQLAEKKVKRQEARLLRSPRRAQQALPHKKQTAIVGEVSTQD